MPKELVSMYIKLQPQFDGYLLIFMVHVRTKYAMHIGRDIQKKQNAVQQKMLYAVISCDVFICNTKH